MRGTGKPPVRFQFTSEGANQHRIGPNTEYAESLGVPLVEQAPPHSRRLAVVGAGPSLKRHLKELRNWKGDIWAINGVVQYLYEHSIESTLFTVDPGERFDLSRLLKAKDALVATACDKSVFNAFKGRIQMFYLEKTDKAQWAATGGCSTATRAPMLAIRMGYRDITFFGCEGSYPLSGSSHVDHDYKKECELWVKAGGNLYRTDPEGVMQSQYLSSLIEAFPAHCHEKCGGLLRAMLKYPDTWSMTHVNNALKERLEQSIMEQGAQP